MKKKRVLISLLLALVLTVSLLPVSAGAYEFQYWTEIKDSTIYAHDLKEGASLSLKQDTTLILDADVSLCRISGSEYALTIKDSGGHKLTMSDEDGTCLGTGALRIEGGTLEITSDGTNTFGIHAGGDISILDATVTASGSYTGILALSSDIYIKNSTVTATGGYATGANGIGAAQGGSVLIENSTVTAKAAQNGISAVRIDGKGGDVTIKSGTVNAYGGMDGIKSSYGVIDIQGGTVKTEGGHYGLAAFPDIHDNYGDGEIRIRGGDVTATGTTNAIYSQKGPITISDGAVTACGGINGNLDISGYSPAPAISTGTNSPGTDAADWDEVTPLTDTAIRFVSIRPGVVLPTTASVSVTLTAPEAGANPDDSVSCADATVTGMTWYRGILTERGITEWEIMPATSTFRAGKSYMAVIQLAPESGYVFAGKDTISVTVNGEKLDPKSLDLTDDAMTIYKEFSVTEAQTEPPEQTDPPEQTEPPEQTDPPEQTEPPEQTDPPEQSEPPEQIESPEQSEPPAPTNPFVDVLESDSFYDAVLWAYYAEPQVTNGMDPTHFGPSLTVTRGQCAAFLWRAMGCPEPKSTNNPFVDVPADQYYYKPVLWAVENGITKGVDATHFNPDDTLSTQHIVTFLYRTLNPGQDGWDGAAAAWAGQSYGGRPFGVAIAVDNVTPCPRWCVVQFLYQALK